MKHAPGFLALVEAVMPRIREISADEVAAMISMSASRPTSHEHSAMRGSVDPQRSQHIVLIDVREESEFAAGHAQGAIHLGRGIIERDIESSVPAKDAKIVLYCGGGYRSALAADNLQKMGYTNVWSMSGGWRAWCEKGFPKE
ncbi:MAG: rhodanese-like domain-containing protein [Rickettsiales bacterium]|nr:rhodanese-like domain-containing protein [Rickettsiales bacterium]